MFLWFYCDSVLYSFTQTLKDSKDSTGKEHQKESHVKHRLNYCCQNTSSRFFWGKKKIFILKFFIFYFQTQQFFLKEKLTKNAHKTALWLAAKGFLIIKCIKIKIKTNIK